MKKSKSSLRKIALSIAVASVMTCCGATAILTGCNKDNNTPSGNEQSLPVTVTIAQTANGTVTPDKTSYVSGDTVTLTITPATGYELGSVKVGETDKTASVRNGILVLSNVTENITVTTVFNARTAATVSATVKENKGGSVSLSATSAYVGDNVTLTVAPEAGYEVISVKVNGAEKVGDLNGGNALTLTVTEATTNIEVEYYALPIAANITCNEYGSAQITDKKDNYSIGDNIEVVFTPDNYCKIVSVLVNGEERISELNENKLIITVTAIGNINIAAIFDVTPVPCEFGVSATRYGETYDLNGVNAVLEHKTQDRKYNVSVNASGKIQAEFVPGEYTLTVAGCMPVDVTVTDEGVSTDKNVIYQMFDENNKSGNVDVSVADTVTLKSAYAWITSADTFGGDVLFTTKLKHSSAATYFAVGLIGSSSNKMIAITSEGNSEKLHFKKYGDVLFGGAKFIYDGEYSVNLNSAEQAAFTGNGLTLKIARKGDLLCLIANNGTTDRLLESWDVKDLASQGLKFGMCTFGGAEYTFNVSVGQNESEIGELLDSEVTVATDITNGTVTIDRQDGKYYLGETVTVSVTPDDSGDDNIVYILKSLTVGGIDVTGKVEGGVCKVKVTDKNLQISAVFERVSYVNLSVKVDGLKYGETQRIEKVWLTGSNYARTAHDITNGVLNVNRLTEGEYTIEANGYISKKITVSANTEEYEDVHLIYQIFQDKAGWDLDSFADGYITRTETGNGNAKLFLKDKYTDFLFTTTVKYSQARQMFQIKLSDGKVVGFSTVDNENNIIQLPGNKGANWWTAWDTPWHDASSGWGNFKLTDDEIRDYTSDSGIVIKVVRKVTGDTSKIYIFVGDRLAYTYNDTNFLGGEVECAVVPIKTGAEISFPVAMSVNSDKIDELILGAVTATTEQTDKGTVTLDRQNGKYYIGEEVTVNVTPKQSTDDNVAYVLKSLCVDDVDVTDKVVSGVYKFISSKKTHSITAEFIQVNYANLSVKVTGLKYGETQSLEKVWLSSAGYEKTEHTLINGVLNVTHLTEGEYTIEADGYLPVKVSVVNAATYQDIALNYQIFNENHKDGNVDVSTANSVTLNSAYAWITSKDSFDGDVMFTTTLKHTGSANYFAVAFLGGKNTFASVTATDNASVIKLTGYGDGALWNNCQKLDVTEPSFTLTQDEQTAYKADGLTLIITRKGNTLCIFIANGGNSRLLCSYDVTAYAGQKMEFGMCTFGNTAYTFPVTITQKAGEIDTVVGSTVSANIQGTAGGTVALDNQDGRYNIGGRVTVTVTKPDDADENTVYTVKTFTVNGEDKKSELTATDGGFTYEFTVTEKTVNIIVELEKTEYANLSVNIKGLKYGVEQDITSVTLKNATAGYEEIKSLTDGVLTVEHLIPGDYTIEADGYIVAKVTVEKDATYNGIVLNYQIFDENQHGSIDINTAQSTYQVKSWDVIKLKDTFTGDFVYTVSVQHRNEGGSNRLYMLARFEGNSVLCIGANNDNWHGIHCMDVGANAVFGGEASDYTYIDKWTGMALTDAEWTADQNGKLMLKLVRKGNNVYLIVGHTDESGNYSERLFRSWQGEQYAKAVDFGYVNTTNSAFETPINVSCKTEDIEALVGNKNLDVSVKFMKYGAEQTNITSVKLNDADYTLTDGKLVVNNLPMGIYTLTAEGYAPQTINLLDTKDIVLQYELIGTVKGGTVDQSNLSSGYVTASSWGGATLKEAINGDFVYTFGLKSADNKIYGSLCFMDDAGNTMMSFGVEGNQTDKICAYKAGDGALWTATFLSDNKSYALNADEQTALTAGNILVKLVKNNDKLYVFISQNGNDRLVDTFDIADHASKSVEFGLYNISGSSVNMALSLDTTQAAVDEMVAKVTA